MILCMASCQKENGLLYLETETYTGAAKLHLDNENFAVWDNNDKVLVNGTEYSVAVGSGNTTITGVPEAESYTAIYPASWANSTSITYPAEQTYRGSQVVEAPMAAYSDGGTLTFHNLGSLLAVEVTNSSSETMSVQEIEISAEGSTLINGTCAINGLTTGAPSLGALSNGSSTTTLKCNGVSITAGNTETFYIAMPPVEAQLTVKVYDQYYAYTKTQASAHTMAASHGYAAPIATSDSPVQYAPKSNQILYTSTQEVMLTDLEFVYTVIDHTYLNGKGVVTLATDIISIPEDAFYGDGYITSITLPSGVTSIGDNAFMDCANLTFINMSSVTTIGYRAFLNCSQLNSVDLSAAISIAGSAFYGCSAITSVNIPNVTTIDEQTFRNCSNLTSVSIPNVTTIEGQAFRGCTRLSDVYSNTKNPTVKKYAFASVPTSAVLHRPSSCQGTTWDNWPGQYSYDFN